MEREDVKATSVVAALVALGACACEVEQSTASAPAYQRDRFGSGWVDEDRDCRDTRNEVLARDLTEVTLSSDGCLVLSGSLVDPYTGQRKAFVRGARTSSAVQIDHVLPLKAAWDAGAWAWSDAQRRAFSNDLDNLVATAGEVNQDKSAKPPSAWASSVSTGAACAYVQTVALNVTDYGLSLSSAESTWIEGFLDDCRTPLVSERTEE